jgi:hypothetical protein
MLSSHDCIIKRISGIALLVLLFNTYPAISQESILDSAFTFQAGMVKTGNALNIISRRTGYYFTYDSKLIDTERKAFLNFSRVRLQTILDSVLQNDSLKYSVINKYIIIYKVASRPDEKAGVKPEREVSYISGIITDFETGDPLPFATIGIISTGRGTVSNNNGEFGLKIPRESINDSLSVSYLGYYSRKIPVMQAINNFFNIRMMREYIPIPEIIIKNQVPQEIMRKAYASIARNYGSSPANMRAFYREAVLKKSTLQIYSEAIIDIFKSSYSGSIFSDQMKIIKSRKTENLGLKDTLTIRLKAGLSTCLLLDGARNTFDFLLPENYSQYDYRMTDIVTVDDESAYVIEFVQKPMVNIPLFKGSIYINTYSYAIIQAEFEINPQYINDVREEFINTAAKGYKMWPTSIKYYVNYRKMYDRYFLNHVRGELNFTAKQNKRLFSSTFSVFFELAVTDIKIENVTRFDRDEVAPTHSIFSKTISSYDPEFWGDMDFLKPEENLLQALKNMKAKMQEFSK